MKTTGKNDIQLRTLAKLENAVFDGLPIVSGVAYTGAVVSQWWGNAILDVSGMRCDNPTLPLRFQHDAGYSGIGHIFQAEADKTGNIVIRAAISRENDIAKDVVKSMENGYQWQLSVGGHIDDVEAYETGEEFECNGKAYKNESKYDIFVVRKMTLKEVSIVDLGADPHTSVALESK